MTAANLTAGSHIHHIRVSGTFTFNVYPTAVIGDNAVDVGITARFDGTTPAVPSAANALDWIDGFWGRPTIDAVEYIYWAGVTNQPAVRYFWHVDIEYDKASSTHTGVIFVGHQAVYVDANHSLPDVSWSMVALGYHE